MADFTIETYGCRMNICDSEVIITLLQSMGYRYVNPSYDADIRILNSCSVREDGHTKIFERLETLQKSAVSVSVIIAGCFASFIDVNHLKRYPIVKAVVAPNSYKSLSAIVQSILSKPDYSFIYKRNIDASEAYEGIIPTRLIEDTTTAAITVMKGCNQYCTYCIEPFTRGREYSKDVSSIMVEALDIASKGYREITLVGHIIDKYSSQYEGRKVLFPKLLTMVAEACPHQRIKFLSSHPIYFADKTIEAMQTHHNIMHVVHLPVQTGSDRLLKLMNRGYTVADFKKCIDNVRRRIPDISIITDVMTGFCTETEADFEQTLQLIADIKPYDINIFRFSMRQHTHAYATMNDDVDFATKQDRQNKMQQLRCTLRTEYHQSAIGSRRRVMIEEINSGICSGRDILHRNVMFPNKAFSVGQRVNVHIQRANEHSMIGEAIEP